MIGFEFQFGPFAVAQLRVHAELQSLGGDMQILANENEPSQYEAESRLAQLIYRRFSHVPWNNVLDPD